METFGTPGVIATLVVDDHVMLAEGVASYLNQIEDIRVVGIAGSGQAALAALAAEPVDVVLLDYRLPDTAGDELATVIAREWPAAKVLMITANDDDDVVVRAIKAGCHGFVPKGRTAAELLSAIRAVHAGEAVFDPTVLARALTQVNRSRVEHSRGDDLTPRERQILQLLADGLSTSKIAEKLVLSQATVRNHIQNVLAKLDTHSKLEAVTFAIRQGLVETG